MSKQKKYFLLSVAFLLLFWGGMNLAVTMDPSQNIEKMGLFSRLFSTEDRKLTSVLLPDEYISYCENSESGLKENKEIGDFKFSAFYTSPDYLVAKEFLSSSALDSLAVRQSIKDYGKLTYFSFRIENTQQQTELLKIDLKNDKEYYARLEYMSFDMQHDFKLISGTDTLDCVMYHFERIYNLAPFSTFVLAFPAIDNKTDIKIWYHDKIFNSGIIVLNFDKEALGKLPQLKI